MTDLDWARERVASRFHMSFDASPAQLKLMEGLREQIVTLAATIEAEIPNGRNKSLALTALEDVQMRANRALFDPEASRFPATENRPEGTR